MVEIINPSRWEEALFVVERNDGAGFALWEDHARREPGADPDYYVLMFGPKRDEKTGKMLSADEVAERYNCEELKNTGTIVPVTINAIEEFCEKLWAEGLYYVIINFDRNRDDNRPIRLDDLMRFLKGEVA